MAKPDSPLREGSQVKHPRIGKGKVDSLDGKVAVVVVVDKAGVKQTHYVAQRELKRVEDDTDGNV